MHYNFNKRFAPDVESGKKRQTIRKKGKRRPPLVGEPLQLYTGMRTKYCRLLVRENCRAVSEIIILPDYRQISTFSPEQNCYIMLGAHDERRLNAFVMADGFKSANEFFEWFENQVGEDGIFVGHLIQW